MSDTPVPYERPRSLDPYVCTPYGVLVGERGQEGITLKVYADIRAVRNSYSLGILSLENAQGVVVREYRAEAWIRWERLPDPLDPFEQRARDIVQQITPEPGGMVLIRVAPGTSEAEARRLMAVFDAFFRQLACPIMALLIPGNVSVEHVAPEIMAHLGWVRRDEKETLP